MNLITCAICCINQIIYQLMINVKYIYFIELSKKLLEMLIMLGFIMDIMIPILGIRNNYHGLRQIN